MSGSWSITPTNKAKHATRLARPSVVWPLHKGHVEFAVQSMHEHLVDFQRDFQMTGLAMQAPSIDI